MLCIHVISLQLMSHLFGRYEKKLKFLRPSPGFEPSKPIYMCIGTCTDFIMVLGLITQEINFKK